MGIESIYLDNDDDDDDVQIMNLEKLGLNRFEWVKKYVQAWENNSREVFIVN